LIEIVPLIFMIGVGFPTIGPDREGHPVTPGPYSVDTEGPYASRTVFDDFLPSAAGTSPTRRSRAGRGRPANSAEQVVVIGVDLARVRAVVWQVSIFMIVMDFAASAAAGLTLAPYTFTRFFDADAKVNFPTGDKTTLLMAAALLMLGCWTALRRRGDPAAKGWLLLALVTIFAFVDETTWLHQSLSAVLSDKYHFTGVLKYAWTVVYVPAAVLVGIILLRHLRAMGPVVRNRLLPAGAVYVVGAIGFEPVKSLIAGASGDGSLPFKMVAAASDSTEMAGLAMMVCAMLHAVRAVAPGFSFALRSTTDDLA
jgi:hypothetical protein